MIKKFLIFALLVSAMALGVFSAVYEPYTLCYNSTYAGSHEGIQAGWTLDNRGGFLRTGIMGGYDTLSDISPLHGSALYRDLNRTDEGVVTFETALSIKNGFDGLTMCFTDSSGELTYALETDDGSFYLLGADGARTKLFTPADQTASFRFLITLDFENGVSRTVISGVEYQEAPLLSDNIARFAFRTSAQDILTVVPKGVKLTANYTLHDDFTYYTSSSKQIPYGWVSEDANKAYVAGAYGVSNGGAALKKSFSRVDGRQALEGVFYVEPDAIGSFALYDDDAAVMQLVFGQGALYCEDETVYTELLDEFWYRFRVETDFDTHTAIVKLNGRVLAEVPLPADISGANRVEICGDNSGIRFDDIKLFALVQKEDYVPEPVIPNDSANNIVGLNVCSLWAYTSNHGWSCVTPYEEYRPVLGYYDEGSAETADWEIKFLTEHGVDFQAFCWYADNTNAPLKNTRNSIHLHDGYMNAKYSELMKYCIIWEAANGAHPANSNAFRSYFVPYWIENYFKDERYMTIANKPLLLVFGINHFISDMGGVANTKVELDYLRQEVKKLGFDDLIILASNATDSDTLLYAGLDGCYAYNWGTAGYDVDYSIGRIVSCADIGKTYTVPTLSTGFNSLPWHGKRYPNMNLEDYERGLMWIRDEYFETYPSQPWQERFMMLSTWNEYGEGTYIMPAEKLHGFGYLDVIREVFTDDDVPHNDVIPTETQLSRITKNYPQHIRLLRRLDNTVYDPETTLVSLETLSYADRAGFLVGNAQDVSYEGSISGTSLSAASSKLAYVETRDIIGFDLSRAEALCVKMSVSADTEVKLYYTTSELPLYTASHCLTFTAQAGGMQDYYLYTSGLSGTLEKVRILPAESADVRFSIASLSIMAGAKLFIDEKQLDSTVYAERRDGKMYYPFDPSLAEGYLINAHFEWDYASQTLSIYGADGAYIIYTVGSDTALTDKGEQTLPCELFLSDGLPMLPMESLCEALGFEYSYEGYDFHLRTPDYEQHRYIFNHPENEWSFSYGTDFGWNGNALSSIENNTLFIQATDNDPRIMKSNLSLSAYRYSGIEVCLAYKTLRASDSVQFFFITNNDTTWNEEKSVRVRYSTMDTAGEFVTIRLDFSNNVYWKDTITALRFDPFSAAGSTCFVKYIKLIPNSDSQDTGNAFAPFESVILDAEDGIVPFYSGNATITVVTDPTNPENLVYRVTPKVNNTYIHMNYAMYFEPGAEYQISFDVMAGGLYNDTETQVSTVIHADPRYDDPRQYGQKNPDDHILNAVSPGSPSNSNTWRYVERDFTVDPSGFIRSTDEFRIYANPAGGKSVEFYIDNLVISKVSKTAVTIDTAMLDSNGTLTVSGNTGAVLTSAMTAILAVYDQEGRLCKVQALEYSDNADFTVVFDDVSEASYVKFFLWSGLRTLKPYMDCVEKTVSR